MTSNQATANWTWSGNTSQAADIALTLYRGGLLVSGYPVILGTGTRSYSFTGLSANTDYSVKVTFDPQSGYLGGSSSCNLHTPVAQQTQLPAPSVQVGTVSASAVTLNLGAAPRGVDHLSIIAQDAITGATVSSSLSVPYFSTSWPISGLQAQRSYRFTVNYHPSTGYLGSNTVLSATTAAAIPRVVLLLHGMNSSPATWDVFTSNISVTAPEISGGTVLGGLKGTPDAKGVYYYRVKFGVYDPFMNSGGRYGIEGIISDGAAGGDFTSFDQLGLEVMLGIRAVRSLHGNSVEIALAGHSRGGLAARAFLQGGSYATEKGAVKALLTIGTPHQGSPLARIHPYLAADSQPMYMGGLSVSSGSTLPAIAIPKGIKTASGFSPYQIHSATFGGSGSMTATLFAGGKSMAGMGGLASSYSTNTAFNFPANATTDYSLALSSLSQTGFSGVSLHASYRKDADTWNRCDAIRNPLVIFNGMDVRRPTVGDMSDLSSQISNLNRAVGSLPTSVTYACLRFSGFDLGMLHPLLDYKYGNAVFGSGTASNPVSQAARQYLIGVNGAPANFMGDGVVPLNNQSFASISGAPIGIKQGS